MIRTNNNFLRLTIAAVMLMVMASTAIIPALAYPNNFSEGTGVDKQAAAAITKILKMPIGTNIPSADFVFEFKAKSADGETATTANMPEIRDITIKFDNNTPATESSIKVAWLESEDIKTYLTSSFPHAGEFIYTVTEKEKTYDISTQNKEKEWMVYSKASYDITFIVDHDKNNGDALYVRYIVAERTITDDGGTPGTEKVDPTPGSEREDVEYSQLIFTNIYSKTNGGGPEKPGETSLEISKKVKGDGARQDIYFKFDVSIKTAEIGHTLEKYAAYVVNEDGSVVSNITANNISTPAIDIGSHAGNQYFLIVPGESNVYTIGLKHNQRLVFVNLEVGMSFTLNEQAANGYKAGYKLILNGVDPTVEKKNDSVNQALAVEAPGGKAYIGEAKNSVDYENERDIQTPTGLDVSELPYMLLMGMAAAALVGFVAIKSRKKV